MAVLKNSSTQANNIVLSCVIIIYYKLEGLFTFRLLMSANHDHVVVIPSVLHDHDGMVISSDQKVVDYCPIWSGQCVSYEGVWIDASRTGRVASKCYVMCQRDNVWFIHALECLPAFGQCGRTLHFDVCVFGLWSEAVLFDSKRRVSDVILPSEAPLMLMAL